MNRKSVKPFHATINLGLEIGYSEQKISKQDVIHFIQHYQNKLIEDKNIYLSCSVYKCEIVLSGQIEPHLKIGFINYPKFNLNQNILKIEIEELAKQLMKEFFQNRIVIEFNDELLMLEISNEIDSRIKKTTGNKV